MTDTLEPLSAQERDLLYRLCKGRLFPDKEAIGWLDRYFFERAALLRVAEAARRVGDKKPYLHIESCSCPLCCLYDALRSAGRMEEDGG